MVSQALIDSFLAQYPLDPERGYYSTLCEFMVALNPDITEQNGFACILMLESGAEIRLKNHRFVNGDDVSSMGTIGDISECIALFFAYISDNPIWWKANYPSSIADFEVRQCAKQLIEKTKKLEIVSDVKVYI